jgi:PAS domain S-box-containing protein
MRCGGRLAAVAVGAGGGLPDRRRHAPAEAAYFRKLLEQLPLGAFVAALRPEPRLLYVTPYVAQALGIPPGAPTSELGYWATLIPPPERARVVAAVDRLLVSGEPLQIEGCIVCPSGRERCWEAHAVVVEDQHGRAAYVVGFCQDVTDREEAIRAVRESEARYRELVETTTDVIYTVSPAGIITSLNSAFEALTGWPRDQWIGRSFAPLIHPLDLPRATSSVARAIAGETLQFIELRTRARSGEYRIGEFAITPQVRDGKVVGAVGVGRDVTDRRRDEESLRQARLREGRLEGVTLAARYLAHILNNDLSVGVAALDLLQLRGRLPDGLDELVRDAAQALQHAAQHVEKLQRVVRIETRETPVGPALDLERSIQS